MPQISLGPKTAMLSVRMVPALVTNVRVPVQMLTLVLLTRHNLRVGRGDRKLAFRLACFFFAAVVLQWIFAAHHVFDLSQVEVFFGVLYRAFFAFGLAWLFYIAL